MSASNLIPFKHKYKKRLSYLMFLSRSLFFAFSLSVICSNILVYIGFHSVDSHFILFCFRCKSTYKVK